MQYTFIFSRFGSLWSISIDGTAWAISVLLHSALLAYVHTGRKTYRIAFSAYGACITYRVFCKRWKVKKLTTTMRKVNKTILSGEHLANRAKSKDIMRKIQSEAWDAAPTTESGSHAYENATSYTLWYAQKPWMPIVWYGVATYHSQSNNIFFLIYNCMPTRRLRMLIQWPPSRNNSVRKLRLVR